MDNKFSLAIDSVGNRTYKNEQDFIDQGGGLIKNIAGGTIALATAGTVVNSVTGSGAALLGSLGIPSITSSPVISGVTKLATGIGTTALGVGATVAGSIAALGVGNALGLHIGGQLAETEGGREFLREYYETFTSDEFYSTLGERVFTVVNPVATTFMPLKLVQKAADWLLSQNVFLPKTVGNITYIAVSGAQPQYVNKPIDFLNMWSESFLSNSGIEDDFKDNFKSAIGLIINKIQTDSLIYGLTNTIAFITASYVYDSWTITYQLNHRADDTFDYWVDDYYYNLYISPTENANVKIEQYIATVQRLKYELTTFKSDDILYPTQVGTAIERNNISIERSWSYCELPDKPLDIDVQVGATYPVAGESIETTFPEWYQNALKVTNIDGTITEYLPISIANSDVLSELKNLTQADAQTGTITADNTLVIDQAVADSTEKAVAGSMVVPLIPSLNTGLTPVIPLPLIGSSNTGFITIYLPTKEQVKQLAQYMWSANFIDALPKLVIDPIECVISFGIMFTPKPPTHVGTITAGFHPCNVQSEISEQQYVEFDCGSITINEYFGNVLDYDPYTNIQLYLPFIGFVNLNVSDVMASIINLRYKIDLLSGVCSAILNVKKDGLEADLYTFNGNCLIQLPITGFNFGEVYKNLATSVGEIALSYYSGGKMLPTTNPLSNDNAIKTSFESAYKNAQTIGGAVFGGYRVNQGSCIGSNYSALNSLTPFLQINRPTEVTPQNYQKFFGKASSKTVKLNKLQGFTRVSSVHVDGISNAIDDELELIHDALIGGIII